MLFCMGNLSLRRGQHIGICLFEPRYRMMVAKALANDGKFGIVVDSCCFRAAGWLAGGTSTGGRCTVT